MTDTESILTDLINNIRTDVVNSMQAKGRYATGETIAAIEAAITDSGAQLLAPWWIDALEVGRKPTSSGATQGDPPMINAIAQWCVAKGIPVDAAWAIKKSIDKNGYVGKQGVLTEPLAAADSHIDTACEQIADQHAQKIADLFNIFD